MPDPGFARYDLCSIRTAGGQEELAGAVREGFSADGYPLADDDPPAPLASGIDRGIRLSTAAAVLAVAGIAAYVSYWHAYAVVRAHGETGITARLEPATIDGLVYASSMVVLYAARHRVPVPSLARWLLALGIAATLTTNMAQGWSHGPLGAVVAAWPAVSLVGSYELLVWLIRTSGPHVAGRRPSTCAIVRPAVLQPVRSRLQPLTATAPEKASAAQQTWRSGPRITRTRPSPPTGSVTRRRLRPAPATTRRWPRTGSACRPATRCRNDGSPRCSDAHPAAGREPELPMHDRHHRSQTRRAPRSRLNDRPSRHLGERARRHNPLAQVPSCPEDADRGEEPARSEPRHQQRPRPSALNGWALISFGLMRIRCAAYSPDCTAALAAPGRPCVLLRSSGALGRRDGQSCADNHNRLQEAPVVVPVWIVTFWWSIAPWPSSPAQGPGAPTLLAHGLRGWLVFGQVQRAGGVMPKGD